MADDDLDAFLYGRKRPPRAPARPSAPPPPEVPPPPRRERGPRRERAPRRARTPRRLRLPPDWRKRLRSWAVLCGVASVALSLLFLVSCGERDAKGLCRPGPGGLGALGDAGKMAQFLAAAAFSAGAGGGLGILLGPVRGSARLAGALWLAVVWVLYFAYLGGLFGDPSKEGAALYQNLTNASSTQGWLLAFPYRVEERVLGSLLGFPSALAPVAAFGVAGAAGWFLARRGRRLDY